MNKRLERILFIIIAIALALTIAYFGIKMIADKAKADFGYTWDSSVPYHLVT